MKVQTAIDQYEPEVRTPLLCALVKVESAGHRVDIWAQEGRLRVSIDGEVVKEVEASVHEM